MRRLGICLTGALLASASNAAPLHLICSGSGSANKQSMSSINEINSEGKSSEAQILSERTVGFEDQVSLDLSDDGTGKIRMPRAMLPGIHGGADGWFDVKSVKFADDEITGTVQVNFINSPKLRLDRLHGSISISGKAGEYFGVCRPYDPQTVQRQF